MPQGSRSCLSLKVLLLWLRFGQERRPVGPYWAHWALSGLRTGPYWALEGPGTPRMRGPFIPPRAFFGPCRALRRTLGSAPQTPRGSLFGAPSGPAQDPVTPLGPGAKMIKKAAQDHIQKYDFGLKFFSVVSTGPSPGPSPELGLIL